MRVRVLHGVPVNLEKRIRRVLVMSIRRLAAAIGGLTASLIAVNELEHMWPLMTYIQPTRKPNKVSQKKRRLNARRLGKYS